MKTYVAIVSCILFAALFSVFFLTSVGQSTEVALFDRLPAAEFTTRVGDWPEFGARPIPNRWTIPVAQIPIRPLNNLTTPREFIWRGKTLVEAARVRIPEEKLDRAVNAFLARGPRSASLASASTAVRPAVSARGRDRSVATRDTFRRDGPIEFTVSVSRESQVTAARSLLALASTWTRGRSTPLAAQAAREKELRKWLACASTRFRVEAFLPSTVPSRSTAVRAPRASSAARYASAEIASSTRRTSDFPTEPESTAEAAAVLRTRAFTRPAWQPTALAELLA